MTQPSEPEASAPAPHTVLIQSADDGSGSLLVSHLLCASAPAYVPAMPAAVSGPDELVEPRSPGVLMIDLIQAVVGHTCPPDAPKQTVGSLL